MLPRLRLLLCLDLSLSVGLLLIGVSRAAPSPLVASYIFQVLWSVSWIALASVGGAPGLVRGGAVVAVFGVHAFQLLGGLLADNVAASAVLCSGSALIVAFVLPWGAATQAVSAALAGLLILAQACAAVGFAVPAFAPALALPLAVLLASVLVSIDVERKAAAESAMQQELRDAHEKLEERVASRTAELVEAKEIAERATRARQRLIAHTSHDLRTPINVIWGYKDMLVDSGLEPEQLEFAERIGRAANQLRRLSDDLLDLLKADVGEIEMRQQAFSLEDVLERAVEPFEQTAHAQGVQLQYEIASSVPERVLGDPDRLRQILANLIGNAVKFTLRGEVGVRVSVDRAAAGEAPENGAPVTLRFEVRDTGVGLAPEDQERVFEAFTQVDGAHYEGSGLGLAICRRFVEILGGTIHVQSELGKGSTFWFTVPYARVLTARAAAAG